MKKNLRLTTREAAKALGVCVQRVTAKIQQGHFPSAGFCECGRSLMIPQNEIEKELKRRDRK